MDGWDSIIPTFRDGDILLSNKEGSNQTIASIGTSEIAAEREILSWPPANCEIPSAPSSISEVDGIDGDHRNSICPNGTTHSFDCHISVCEAHLIPPQVNRYSQTNLHEPYESKLFAALMLSARDDDIFVDVGAAMDISLLWPSGSILGPWFTP